MDTVQRMLWSSSQAQYAGASLAAMVTVVAVGMLFSPSASMALKVAAIASFVIGVLPSAFFSLLQINCLVNGQSGGRWWCSAYGWVLSAVVIVMAVAVVVSVAMALVRGEAVPVTEGFSASSASAEAKKKAEDVLASLMDAPKDDDDKKDAAEKTDKAKKEPFGTGSDEEDEEEDETDELEAADAADAVSSRERVTVEAFTI